MIANKVPEYLDVFFIRFTTYGHLKVKAQIFAPHHLRKVDFNVESATVITGNAINAPDDLLSFFFQLFVANRTIQEHFFSPFGNLLYNYAKSLFKEALIEAALHHIQPDWRCDLVYGIATPYG
jgi:hypothetical protein